MSIQFKYPSLPEQLIAPASILERAQSPAVDMEDQHNAQGGEGMGLTLGGHNCSQKIGPEAGPIDVHLVDEVAVACTLADACEY